MTMPLRPGPPQSTIPPVSSFRNALPVENDTRERIPTCHLADRRAISEVFDLPIEVLRRPPQRACAVLESDRLGRAQHANVRLMNAKSRVEAGGELPRDLRLVGMAPSSHNPVRPLPVT